MRFALLLTALLASNLFGQISVSVVKYQQVDGIKGPTIVGSALLAESIESITAKPVAMIVATSDSGSEIRVDASDQSRQKVAVEEIKGSVSDKPIGYLLSAPGKTWVEVREFVEIEINGVKRKLLSDSKLVIVELGPPPPPPTPPPPPPPPVPPDSFGNIGQRVATWSAGLPKRKELAAVYKNAAIRLRTDLQATVNVVTSDIVAQRSSVLGSDYQAYAKFIENLNADLRTRTPMTKGTLADYCAAIALGLEAQ